MAERKSVNKYYPPDWDPSKGSINNYVGQHPLRDRAKKLGQGILVIRFEMPYNIWCGGCNSHIGMGVRYNAEKTKTGKYYTTPIYKFRMKCHLCDNYFEIQTDPKNHDYVILEGARRKEQRWDPKENEQIVPEDKATQKKMATDAMFKLEHGSDDVKRGQKVKANLGSLESRREEWKDDFILNKMARQKFREEKKCLKKVEAADEALLTKSSLDIPLVKETEDDAKIAGLMKYRATETYDEKQAQKRQAIEDRPLFNSGKKLKHDNEDNDDTHKLDIIRKQIRMGKTGRTSGLFDRMNMNSCKSMNTLTQSTLGIRRKPKDSTKQTEETSTDSNEKKQVENQDIQITEYLGDKIDKGEFANEENAELNGSESISSERLEPVSSEVIDKDKLNSHSESIDIQNKLSPIKEKDSTLHYLKKTAEKDIDTSKVKAPSGLSLVSLYSDSDSDSSS